MKTKKNTRATTTTTKGPKGEGKGKGKGEGESIPPTPIPTPAPAPTPEGKGKGKGKGRDKGKGKGKGEGAPPVAITTHANGADFSPERPGVLAHIVAHLLNATKTGGLTKGELLDLLTKDFPDRAPAKMKSTIAMQIPSGMHIEKGYPLTSVLSPTGKRFYLTPDDKGAGDTWRNHPDGGMTGTLPRPPKKAPIGTGDDEGDA